MDNPADKINKDLRLKFNIGPISKINIEKNKLKNKGIKINPNGIKILKFSSKVREYTIQWIPLRKYPNPKAEPNMNRFFLNGFFL